MDDSQYESTYENGDLALGRSKCKRSYRLDTVHLLTAALEKQQMPRFIYACFERKVQ